MKLSALLDTLPQKTVINVGIPDPEIGSVHCMSTDVVPGGLFIAVPGLTADGHDYIDDALAKGASAVVVQKPVSRDITVVEVKDTRKALAELSAKFYGYPSTSMTVIGLTGTNGKTTTSFLIESILEKAGFRTGVIGTVNYRHSNKIFDNPMTTPESLDLQRILHEMATSGVTHVVLEVSSHAIDLGRVDSCWFDVCLFTNLTQDHLDYHENMSSYWACKKRLFTDHLSNSPKADTAIAVINCNNDRGQELLKTLSVKCLSVGFSDDYTIRAERIENSLSGISCTISIPEADINIRSSLVGTFNIENILCAAGAGHALGISPEIIKKGLESFQSVPGRLERISDSGNRFIFVDYAHTPDALENVMSTLKTVSDGKMISVFGCGGDRDSTKRPLMGKIAGKYSDLTVITSDNPRTEDPLKIIRQILDGTQQVSAHEYDKKELENNFNNKGYVVEPDRRKAIQLGISMSSPGDTVLIAGKGHETYQIIGEKTIPFDDRVEAKIALGNHTQ